MMILEASAMLQNQNKEPEGIVLPILLDQAGPKPQCEPLIRRAIGLSAYGLGFRLCGLV